MSLAGCLLALLPAAAVASTVSKSGSTLTYNAAAGETNNTIVSLSGATYTVDDSGATITTGSGCALVNSHRATCAAAGVTGVTINSGNMNDLAWETAATPATITGADGNDTAIGNNGADVLIGCAGNDSLLGGGGADVMVDTFFNCAGSGNDSFDGGAGPDNMQGGPGSDTVTYSGRSAPVFVDLDGAADDGEPGEGDQVGSDIENVTAGAGPDDITGGPGANTLNGGGGDDVILGEDAPDAEGPGGNDTILGGAGDDALGGGDGNNLVIGGDGDDFVQGGTGADSIDGGNGNDDLHALDGVIDTVNCGIGSDSGEADTDDVVSPSCEAVAKLDADSIDTGEFPDEGEFPIDCGSGDSGEGGDDGDGSGFGGDFPFADEGIPDCLPQDAGCSTLRISHRRTALRHGEVAIRLSLPDAGEASEPVTCRGKLKLSLPGNARKAHSRRVRIGAAAFSLRSGKSKRVEIKVSKPGRRMFGRAERLEVRAAAFVRQGGKASKVASAPVVVEG